MANDKVRKITGVAILLAIEILFQALGNLVTFPGGISLNLSLIPIALSAIIYGPLAGAFLGLINGVIVLFSPSTQAFFMTYAPFGTVVTCLTKCTIAGLVSGLLFKVISKKNAGIAGIIASLIVPIINTGIFALCALTIMLKAIEVHNEGDVNNFKFIFIILIGWNFIFEFLVTSVLSPTVLKIQKLFKRNDENAL